MVEEESSQVELMTRAGESLREASAPKTLLTTKRKTRIGTWNIRTLYETGRTAQVSREMHRYNLKILGLCETRWNGTGQTRLLNGDTIICSEQEEGQPHTHGVALLMTSEAARALLSWEPVSPRMLLARYNSKGRKVTIIQCYAPTNAASADDKEEFYNQLQATIDRVPKRDMKIIMGDMNAKVGADNTAKELIMGKHGVGEQNENGELFTDFCTFNDLVIGGTVFPHKTIHKTTWVSPDGKTENQIDHITIAEIRTKLKAFKDQADRPAFKYNVYSLKDKAKVNEYKIELKNKFSVLEGLTEETVEDQWHDLRNIWTSTCNKVMGKKTREHKEWLSPDKWKLITDRKELKEKINLAQNQEERQELQALYWETNRQVKKSARKDKRAFIHQLTEEAETAAGKRDMKRLYEITRVLSGRTSNPTRPV
ncbi:uncharacterized protein LOC143277998 [Babylonia areolata]|uniref:uncharacterized protein LOC143277998 n=1 Tax=Babylonia areolata TaxID=304850 RepID=UPI003FD643D6